MKSVAIAGFGRFGKTLFRLLGGDFEIGVYDVCNIKKSSRYTKMTHSQVVGHCKINLARKYPTLKLTSGKGKLIDHSKVSKELSKGNLSPNIATMGSKLLASIYGLKIVEENLQDLENNYTSFLLIQRKCSN